MTWTTMGSRKTYRLRDEKKRIFEVQTLIYRARRYARVLLQRCRIYIYIYIHIHINIHVQQASKVKSKAGEVDEEVLDWGTFGVQLLNFIIEVSFCYIFSVAILYFYY